MGRLGGKAALVTGASRGIRRALATVASRDNLETVPEFRNQDKEKIRSRRTLGRPDGWSDKRWERSRLRTSR